MLKIYSFSDILHKNILIKTDVKDYKLQRTEITFRNVRDQGS